MAHGLVTLGPRLRELRLAAGLTVDELAEELSLWPGAIKGWEAGTRRVDACNVIRLARQFRIRPFELIEREPTPIYRRMMELGLRPEWIAAELNTQLRTVYSWIYGLTSPRGKHDTRLTEILGFRVTTPDPGPLALRIQQFRDYHSETRTQLSKATGINGHTLARLERGEQRDPMLSTIQRLARHYGVTSSQFLEGIE